MKMDIRRVKMPCGGSLTFSLEANPLVWPKADREVFFSLVDALSAYDEFNRVRNIAEAKAILAGVRARLESATALVAVDPHADNTGTPAPREANASCQPSTPAQEKPQ